MGKTLDVKWTESGEAYIELDDDMLSVLNVKEGDEIVWIDNQDGSWTLKKKETEYVLVEAISTFRMRYLVEVPVGKKEYALDSVVMNECKEFSQEHLGETIVSHRVVSEEEAIKQFREDNAYLSSWTDEQIINSALTTFDEKVV